MAINIIDGSNVIKPDGSVAKRVVLTDSDTPASLELTGADVPGLNEDDVIAVGSVLITPSANYIAFTDGVFTQKSGGSGGGGSGTDNRLIVNFTVTAQDFSGTMDKTNEELVAAYDAGKSVIAHIANGTMHLFAPLVNKTYADGVGANLSGQFYYTQQNMLIGFTTGTGNTYQTQIYQLTPYGS